MLVTKVHLTQGKKVLHKPNLFVLFKRFYKVPYCFASKTLFTTWFLKRFILASLLLVSSQSYAQLVSEKLPSSGLHANAEYVKGDPKKPAVLILHGFLVTNEFHTVVAMGKALQAMGVTTLSPTLTLGIDQRAESVRCQSIHTHTLENDIDELNAWVQWLKAQGHEKIILIGHSSGSVELLEYMNKYADSAISSVIFTSMFYLSGKELGSRQDDFVAAQEMVQTGKKRPRNYHLLFCKGDYTATPESFLSYAQLNRDYVLSSLKALKVPTFTIMGGADKRYQSVGRDWLKALEQANTRLIIVEGANHFFSSEYEFDLQDQIVAIVENAI